MAPPPAAWDTAPLSQSERIAAMKQPYRKPTVSRAQPLAKVTADPVKLISGFTAKDDR
jgi:hypothetical protein